MKRFLFAALLCAGAAIGQPIYHYTDQAGNLVSSDQPPPSGTPYTIQQRVPPGAMPPRIPFPATYGPQTLPGSGPEDPQASRDRGQFVPADEPETQRRDQQVGVPADEGARQHGDVSRNVPQGEAGRTREGMRISEPQGEVDRIGRDLQTDIPADEITREREGIRRNE
jgi:hypothetical protein